MNLLDELSGPECCWMLVGAGKVAIGTAQIIEVAQGDESGPLLLRFFATAVKAPHMKGSGRLIHLG